MTPGQRKVYDFIAEFWRVNGHAPSYREIAEGIGVRSVSSVYRRVHGLIKRGHATLVPDTHRSVMVKTVKMPRLGGRGTQ